MWQRISQLFIVLGYHNVGGCRLVDDRQKSPVNKSLDLVSYHGMTLKMRQKREREGEGGYRISSLVTLYCCTVHTFYQAFYNICRMKKFDQAKLRW